MYIKILRHVLEKHTTMLVENVQVSKREEVCSDIEEVEEIEESFVGS
jgi:hypothetical protein